MSHNPHNFFDMKKAVQAGRVAAHGERLDLSEYLKGPTMSEVEVLVAQAEGYGEKLSKGVDIMRGADMIKGAKLLSKLFNRLGDIHAGKLERLSEHQSGPSAPAA